MQIETASAERLALDAAALALDPPPPVDYVRWAESNIAFTERESPFPGPYNRTMFPYFDEPLRALSASRPHGSRDAFCVRPVCRQGPGEPRDPGRLETAGGDAGGPPPRGSHRRDRNRAGLLGRYLPIAR